MVFTTYFNPFVLERTNKFSTDILLLKHYEDIEDALKKESAWASMVVRNQLSESAFYKVHDEIAAHRTSFLIRLSSLEDSERFHQLEVKNQIREGKVFRFTIAATAFAALASLLSLLGVGISYLQVSEAKAANQLMLEQNKLMHTQNELTLRTLNHSTEKDAKKPSVTAEK